MTTAREIMTPDPTCVRSSDTVRDAADRMAELSVGSAGSVEVAESISPSRP